MQEMCQSAIAKGIPEIGFTEHYDLHPDEPDRDWFKPEGWWAEIERCRAEFAGQLTIRAGIEIGEPHLFRAEAQAMLASGPFDYVLGSLHWVGNKSVFDASYFSTTPADTLFHDFFTELAQMTSVADFDILSHFDVPVRLGYGIYGGYDPTRYADVIRPVLQNCIDRGIALDLNTAVLRRHVPIMTPGHVILGWYVEMGGKLVTLGSDAHYPQHVGAGLDAALAMMRTVGIEEVVRFEQRQAYQVQLLS